MSRFIGRVRRFLTRGATYTQGFLGPSAGGGGGVDSGGGGTPIGLLLALTK